MRDFRPKKPPGAGIHFEVQGCWKGAGVKAQEREAREGAEQRRLKAEAVDRNKREVFKGGKETLER